MFAELLRNYKITCSVCCPRKQKPVIGRTGVPNPPNLSHETVHVLRAHVLRATCLLVTCYVLRAQVSVSMLAGTSVFASGGVVRSTSMLQSVRTAVSAPMAAARGARTVPTTP